MSDWGGARIGAGRRPKQDKLLQVYIGVKESRIRDLGGDEKVKAIMKKAVEDVIVWRTLRLPKIKS